MSEVLWAQPDRSYTAAAIADIPFADVDASTEFDPGIAGVSTAHPEPRNPSLRHWLGGLDAAVAIVANLVAWTVLPGASGLSVGGRVLLSTVGALATVLAIAGQGLYRARACAVRSVELVGLARAAGVGAVAGFIVSRLLSRPETVALVAAGALTFLGLAAGRGLFSAWLRRARSHGRFCRSIVVVGAEAEAGRLVWLLRRHPELGLRPVGVMGRGLDEDTLVGVPCLGDLDAVGPTLALVGANGVVIASADLDSEDLNALVRKLLVAGVHVQLSSGLWGIDHSRLRPVPLAHEPFVYVEPSGLRRGQRACKRAVDMVLSSLLLLVSLPIFVLCTIAIRLQDGAPAIFRQIRIGQDGVPFTLFKLRTMVPDAECQLVDVTSVNQRAGGPLFKASHDPRRTPVGRLLERTSLDELPQLLNVLRGDMSIVGPRPALPHEVSEFDDELLGRHEVRPGITGLWQVEARDKPDFEIYRRLDLFYVDNWSIGLDLAVMFSTVCSVAGRVIPHRRRPTEPVQLQLPALPAVRLSSEVRRIQSDKRSAT